MSADAVTFSSLKWVPLYKPAVKEDSCQINHDAQGARIALVVATAFAAAYVSLIVAVGTGSIVAACIVPCAALAAIALIVTDLWLSTRSSKAKAVEEFMDPKVAFCSSAAANIIRNNPSLVQTIVEKKGNLDKVDEEGDILLNTSSFEVFKLLVDNGANLHAKTPQGNTILECAVSNPNPRFAEYIFSQKKVAATEIKDETQHAKLWSTFGHLKTAKLLKDNEFNINAKDKDGYTPLMRAASAATFSGTHWYYGWYNEISAAKRVSTLLNFGADKTPTVKVKVKDDKNVEAEAPKVKEKEKEVEVEKTALQLATNPAIKNLLEQKATVEQKATA